jgi:hypothetical protein
MKLIREVFETVNYISEANIKSGGKDYFIEGIFLQAEMKNRNGRLYPEATMDNAVKNYIENYVEQKRAYGELGHPDSPSINLPLVSHLILELKKDGTNYIGKAKILNTPMGQTVKGLLDGGANLGVSSRALGSLKMNKEGVQIVQDDFVLSTAADIVADPSAPEAFVRGIMEGHEWIYVDGRYVEKQIEETKKIIKSTPSKRLSAVSAEAFEKFLNSLK